MRGLKDRRIIVHKPGNEPPLAMLEISTVLPIDDISICSEDITACERRRLGEESEYFFLDTDDSLLIKVCVLRTLNFV